MFGSLRRIENFLDSADIATELRFNIDELKSFSSQLPLQDAEVF